MTSFETPSAPQHGMSEALAYSAHVQEAMRYDKLSSSHYHLAITILNALSRGYNEERWREDHQRMLQALVNQSPDKADAHADSANRYEQTLSCLKDLTLWPW